jgi:hypothetical protein
MSILGMHVMITPDGTHKYSNCILIVLDVNLNSKNLSGGAFPAIDPSSAYKARLERCTLSSTLQYHTCSAARRSCFCWPLVHVALFKMTISDLELSLIAHFWQAHQLHLMVATAPFRTASPDPHEPYHVLRFPPGNPE